jgi:hypothetical protein
VDSIYRLTNYGKSTHPIDIAGRRVFPFQAESKGRRPNVVARILAVWWLWMAAGGVAIGDAVARGANVARGGPYVVGAALLMCGMVSAYASFRRQSV